MRRCRAFFATKRSRKGPRNRPAAPHRDLAVAISPAIQAAGCRSARTRRGAGCQEDRVWFSCMRFAGRFASRGAGVVFGGNRRVSHPRFGKVSSQYRASSSRDTMFRHHFRHHARREHRYRHYRPSRAPSPLGRRHGANADARLRQCQCQHPAGRSSRQHGQVGQVRLIRRRRRGAPLYRRQSRPAGAACGARAS